MGYTSKVKTYSIDLDLPGNRRWQEVIRDDKKAVKKLIREARKDFEGEYKLPFVNTHVHLEVPALLKKIFRNAYKYSGGYYTDEIDCWADELGASRDEVTMMQCSYELAHAASFLGKFKPRNIFGCTAGVKWINEIGMVHIRNMDWELQNIGNTTRLFKYVRGDRHFVAVGISGFVGVLSGMVPGAYSVTINYAPLSGRPRFTSWGPSFLLRDVLEECDTYEDAVYYLKNERLSTGILYTVCGTKKRQACVIERTRNDASVRKMKTDSFVCANHYVSRKFKKYNTDKELLKYSLERYECMNDLLTNQKKYHSYDNIFKCLNVEPVYNEESYQQMMFVPAKGEVKAKRWV